MSFNQIAGLFDHQYLQKESINLLDILHINSHQRIVNLRSIPLVCFNYAQTPNRLRHMKNKGVQQSHASSRNSEAIDV